MQPDIYDFIIANVEPICLAALFILVALGWVVRIVKHIRYAPPRAAKVMAVATFSLLAYYYLSVEFRFMEHDHRRALLRFTMLFLIAHESVHHLYVIWLRRFSKKYIGEVVDGKCD